MLVWRRLLESVVCVCVLCDVNAGGIFDAELPAVITVAGGETFGTSDIAISNDASLVIGAQFVLSLSTVQLHTGQ